MRAFTRKEVLEYCDNPDNSDDDRKAVVEEFYRVNSDYRLKCLWFNSERHDTVRCQQVYKQQSTVKEHCWTQHLKIKRFECEYPGCGRKFKKKQHMSLHWEAKHSGERKYRCDLCHFKFKHNKHLKRHEKCTHQYACRFPGCHLTFINKTGKNSLRLHEDDAHSGQQPRRALPFGAGAGGDFPEGMDASSMAARYSMMMFGGADRKLNPSMVGGAQPMASPTAAAAPFASHRDALADSLAGRHGPHMQAYAAAYITSLQQYPVASPRGPTPVFAGGGADAFPGGFNQYHQYAQFGGLNHPLHTSSTPTELAHMLQQQQQQHQQPLPQQQQQQHQGNLSKARSFAAARELSISMPGGGATDDVANPSSVHPATPTAAAEMHTPRTPTHHQRSSPQTPTHRASAHHTSAPPPVARVHPQSARRASHHVSHTAAARSRFATSSSMSPMHRRQRPMTDRTMFGDRPNTHHDAVPFSPSSASARSPVAMTRARNMSSPASGASPMAASAAVRRPRRASSDDFASPSQKRVKREHMASPRGARGDIHANVRDPHFHSFPGTPGTPSASRNDRTRDAPMTLAPLTPTRADSAAARYAHHHHGEHMSSPRHAHAHAGQSSPRVRTDDLRVKLFMERQSSYSDRAATSSPTAKAATNTNTTSPRHIAPLPVRPNNVTSSPVFNSPPTPHARPSHSHSMHRSGDTRSSTVYDFEDRRHRLQDHHESHQHHHQRNMDPHEQNSPLAQHHRVETHRMDSRMSNSPLAHHHRVADSHLHRADAPQVTAAGGGGRLHRAHSLTDFSDKDDADRFRPRSVSSPTPSGVMAAADASQEDFVNSCLSSVVEESAAEFRPRNLFGNPSKRQKTAHRPHDALGVNYVQRTTTSLADLSAATTSAAASSVDAAATPRGSSGDDSVAHTPAHSRRESAASFVSTATDSSSSSMGMGGDSEREDDGVGVGFVASTGGVGADDGDESDKGVGAVAGRKRRFPMFGDTPPPLVSNTPEYPLAPSPMIPGMVH